MRIMYELECQKCGATEALESPGDRPDSRCERCGGGPVEFTGKVQRRKTSESSGRGARNSEAETTGKISSEKQE